MLPFLNTFAGAGVVTHMPASDGTKLIRSASTVGTMIQVSSITTEAVMVERNTNTALFRECIELYAVHRQPAILSITAVSVAVYSMSLRTLNLRGANSPGPYAAKPCKHKVQQWKSSRSRGNTQIPNPSPDLPALSKPLTPLQDTCRTLKGILKGTTIHPSKNHYRSLERTLKGTPRDLL